VKIFFFLPISRHSRRISISNEYINIYLFSVLIICTLFYSICASGASQTLKECLLAKRNVEISKIIFMSIIAKSETDGTGEGKKFMP